MFDTNRNERHNDCQEAIGKDTKGGTGKLSVFGVRRGVVFLRHDGLLHDSPSEIRELETNEAETELKGLLEEVGVGWKMLLKEDIDGRRGFGRTGFGP